MSSGSNESPIESPNKPDGSPPSGHNLDVPKSDELKLDKPELDNRWLIPGRFAIPQAGVTVAFIGLFAYVTCLSSYAWIPHDEGTLAHGADRILRGELPHRDFDDAYTGGLSLWNALALRIFGTNLYSIRIGLLLVSAGFLFCFYKLSRRFATRDICILLLALAVAWSLPNYFAGMPSWYITFLAVFSTSALLQFHATRKTSWLIVAGACGGLGLLAKIQALFYIGATLMSLAFLEIHTRTRDTQAPSAETRSRSTTYSLFIALIAMALTSLVVLLVRRLLGPAEFMTYVLPTGILCYALFKENSWFGQSSFIGRFWLLTRWVAFYSLGVTLPILAVLGIYAISGSAGDFITGVLAIPSQWILADDNTSSAMSRFAESAKTYALPSVAWFWSCTPVACLMFLEFGRFRASPTAQAVIWSGAIICIGIAAVMIPSTPEAIMQATPLQQIVYPTICFSFRCLAPITALFIAFMLLDKKRRSRIPSTRRFELFHFGLLAVQVSLMQFPNSTAVYFFFVAPLFILAATALVATMRPALRPVFIPVTCFYLVFAVAWLNTGFIRSHGVRYMPALPKAVLELTRGQLRIDENTRTIYTSLADHVNEVTKVDEAIYAVPDCPEVYFLTNRTNPTRAFFDPIMDPVNEADAFVEKLNQLGVKVIVINKRPEFSKPLSPEFLATVARTYPIKTDVNKKFTIYSQ